MTGKKKATVIIDSAGVEYRRVQLATIEVDPAFSRRIDWQRHLRLVSKWNRKYAGTLICVRRQGRLICVDGVDRLETMRDRCTHAVVQIINGLTDPEIHELFVAANVARTKVTGFDRFRHLYHAKNGVQTDIVKLARAHKIHIPLGIGEPRYGKSIFAYDTLTWIVEKFGLANLAAVFSTLRAYFIINTLSGQLEGAAKKAQFLAGLATHLARTPGYTQLVTALAIADANASDILAEAEARSGAAGGGRGLKALTWWTYAILNDIRAGNPWLLATQKIPG